MRAREEKKDRRGIRAEGKERDAGRESVCVRERERERVKRYK